LNPTDISLFQESFPVNREMIWLNNCGTTPASTQNLKAVSTFLDGYSKHGIFTETEKFFTVKQEIKTKCVELLGGSISEFTLIRNTSEGMNIFSHGLELPNGSTILILENEYPSNVYPWEHLQKKGCTIRFLPSGNSPREFLKIFHDNLDSTTKVVSLSAVHWCTGMPLPLQEIGEICKQRNIYFVVDGAQGVGHIEIDVKKMHIDFMAFSAWKWLLGPLGLGVLYVSQDRLDDLSVTMKGTGSVVDSDTYLPYRNTYKAGADRYEVSTPSFTDWVYFKSSLSFLSEIGFSIIMERIYLLAEYLAKGLKDLNFSVNTQDFSEKTGIIVAKRNNLDSTKVVSHLFHHKIIAASRLGGIRFAPHAYNSEAQIDRVIGILSKEFGE